MKFSLSWLQDYVTVQMDVDQLTDTLTMIGLEVDSVSNRFAYLDSVYVGRIQSVKPHPNADRLKICTVDTGERQLPVVCGAPNAKEEMLAPLAVPGTLFPDGSLLEKGIIRGQASEGMLCSEAELGLGLDASGIMPLDANLAVGARLKVALQLSDPVIEIDLTPNRPDCLSIIGIAREIAAIQKTPLTYPAITLEDPDNKIVQMTSVGIEAPGHCPRYAARLLEGIKIRPSPFWLQDRLLSVGLRPINNIVDITNFVLMELGQPLHAFDFDRLAENRIVVRTATPGESFTTLDQKERPLTSEMLMICDGKKPVAIGGVMGGLNSEIENDTSRVLIESAYFSPVSIRRTSKKLGLSTEASFRFERGVDPEGTVTALNRAAQLMIEMGGGTLIGGVVDEHPRPQKTKALVLSVARTNRLLGTDLNRGQVADLLKSIEFRVENEKEADTLWVAPPSFRVDISRPEDLMEEVARLAGYNNIPTTFPMFPAEGRPFLKELAFRNELKQLLTGFGFTEVITYSFIHKQSCDRLRFRSDDPRRNRVHILNPLVEDQAVMRTSLVPGLLSTMGYNLSQQIKNIKLFEIGKIFIDRDQNRLPKESEVLAGLWSGSRSVGSWHTTETAADFYDIKGVVEALLRSLKIEGYRFTLLPLADCDYARSGFAAEITQNGKPLGRVGEVDPQVLAIYDLKKSAYIFELELEPLQALVTGPQYRRPLPKFPAIFRDSTLIIDRGIEAQMVLEQVLDFKEALVEEVHLFDVYEGSPIPAGRKSISFRITYRSQKKTLVDNDIHKLHQIITKRLMAQFKATLP